MEEAERLGDRVAIMEQGRIINIDTPDSLVGCGLPVIRALPPCRHL